MIKKHTEKGIVVEWVYLKDAQRTLTSHARMLFRIFKIRVALGPRNTTRCHENNTTWAHDPPRLRSAAKTHKPTLKDGSPKIRPIVSENRDMSTALG